MPYDNYLRSLVYQFFAFELPQIPPEFVYKHMTRAYRLGCEQIIREHEHLTVDFIRIVSMQVLYDYINHINNPSQFDSTVVLNKISAMNLKKVRGYVEQMQDVPFWCGYSCVADCPHMRRVSRPRCFLGFRLKTINGKTYHIAKCPVSCGVS